MSCFKSNLNTQLIITPTPPGSLKPQNSSNILIQILPIPPRHSSCFTFGHTGLPIPPNSPTCSEIGGEGVQDDVRAELVLPLSEPQILSSIMEQAEDLVEDTRVKLESRMRMYTALHLDSSNVD